MQLDITGHQITLTDALQHRVREKMQKLERHSDEITHMHVVLNIEKHNHQAEATAHIPGLSCLLWQKLMICMQRSIYCLINSTDSFLNTKRKTSRATMAVIPVRHDTTYDANAA